MSQINIDMTDGIGAMKTSASLVTVQGELVVFIIQEAGVEGEADDVVLLSLEGLIKFQAGLAEALESGRLQIGADGVAEID